MELHMSTQGGIHNKMSLAAAKKLGFSRAVAARELTMNELKMLCEYGKANDIEVEGFIHGALCVCMSGQCLFSSLVGQRSGNRGECAQPCRLSYAGVAGNAYPLSLKDSCLANHAKSILDLGLSSLKIEGRMRSPEYVYTVTSIYRRLIDENRNATPKETETLLRAFSRNGFTDAYYTGNITKGTMCGIRTDKDKSDTAQFEKNVVIPDRKKPIGLYAKFKANEPIEIRLGSNGIFSSQYGEIPQAAKNAPVDRKILSDSLMKFGNTPFEIEKLDLDLENGLFMPKSLINDVRRRAADELYEKIIKANTPAHEKTGVPVQKNKIKKEFEHRKIAVFYNAAGLPDKETLAYFDKVYLDLYAYAEAKKRGLDISHVCGIDMPPMITDKESGYAEELLKEARDDKIEYAVCENIAQAEILKSFGFKVCGGFRLNVYSRHSADILSSLGIEDVFISPELRLPALRAIETEVPKGACVYGKIPLMSLEKCLWRCFDGEFDKAPQKCESACRFGDKNILYIEDRKNIKFPVMRSFAHRNIIFNSVPVYMADKKDDLRSAGIDNEYYLFTDESKEEICDIINRYKNAYPAGAAHRRI